MTKTTTGMARITKSGSMPGLDERCETRKNGKKCGAQAWVFVEFEGGSVLPFCLHDYVEHEDKLVLTAVKVIDHRQVLARLERKQ